MKRRRFVAVLCSVLPGALGAGCLGFSAGTSSTNAPGGMQRPARDGSRVARSGGRGSSNSLGVSNIKDLSAILNRANCPLDNNQTDTLLNFKTEAEFIKNVADVLDTEQLEAVKNDSGGRGRRR
ncbi:hypothetical protein ACFL6K_00650 [Candidatus Latescibacterota bacterium]